MSLDKLNRMPTTATPLGARRPNPLLNVPGTSLFRPGPDYWEHQCLPFVKAEPGKEGDHDDWHFDRPDGLAKQTELGKHFAAAYFLFVSRNGGTCFPLSWIVDSMQHNLDKDGFDAVAQGFFFYLTELLHDFGQYVGPLDVEQHLQAVIARDRTYYEPDALAEVGA